MFLLVLQVLQFGRGKRKVRILIELDESTAIFLLFLRFGMDKNFWIWIKGFTIFRVWNYNYLKHSSNCDDLANFLFYSLNHLHTAKNRIGRNNVWWFFVIRNSLITKKTCENRKGFTCIFTQLKAIIFTSFLTHWHTKIIWI